MSRSHEENSRLEDALDLFVYAPVGLAISAVEELPKMIERGREVLESSVGTARVIGRVAVNQGRVEIHRIVSQWNDLSSVLRSGAVNGRAPRAEDAPAALHDAAAAPAPPPSAPTPPRVAKRAPAAPATLGIPGYESLSASQVVSRLDGLTPQQREAVKAYEASTRGRRTILGRIAQIESGA